MTTRLRPKPGRDPLLALAALAVLLLAVGACSSSARSGAGKAGLAVTSPNGNLTISLKLEAKLQPYMAGERLYYRVEYRGTPILGDSPLGLDLAGADALDHDLEVIGTSGRSNDSTWENAFGALRTVPDVFN
ncbi:MAG TPA: glycoside hydrolase family 97 N-terminal domain-containing protein, partial [Terriglobales bacterium]|nr:glycoside hydrolase family 97 N-terminal domain-containing protein [Terriglobales bacterium]